MEALKGMTERPQFVGWATMEGEREGFGYAVRSSDSERASAVRFAPGGTRTSHGDGQCRASQTSAARKGGVILRAAGTAAVAASVR